MKNKKSLATDLIITTEMSMCLLSLFPTIFPLRNLKNNHFSKNQLRDLVTQGTGDIIEVGNSD